MGRPFRSVPPRRIVGSPVGEARSDSTRPSGLRRRRLLFVRELALRCSSDPSAGSALSLRRATTPPWEAPAVLGFDEAADFGGFGPRFDGRGFDGRGFAERGALLDAPISPSTPSTLFRSPASTSSTSAPGVPNGRESPIWGRRGGRSPGRLPTSARRAPSPDATPSKGESGRSFGRLSYSLRSSPSDDGAVASSTGRRRLRPPREPRRRRLRSRSSRSSRPTFSASSEDANAGAGGASCAGAGSEDAVSCDMGECFPSKYSAPRGRSEPGRCFARKRAQAPGFGRGPGLGDDGWRRGCLKDCSG